MRKLSVIIISILILAVLAAGCGTNSSGEGSGEVNIYSARHYESDDRVLEMFEQETGIKVNVVKANAEELIERLKREGASTPADLFITVDGGVLAAAKLADILQPISSKKITANVPAEYRDKDNQWVGIATRARVIVYSKDRVNPSQLSTYEDLTAARWKGKVLARTSTNLYNLSMMASFIELNGEAKAEEWARGIVSNFSRDPQGNDRDQAKAVVAGVGDLAIMNTYYIGLLANSANEEDRKVAESVGVFFPNQQTTGTHINISGIGLTKHSKNKANAIKLIEYMTDVKAQEFISNNNYEFPVNPKAKKAPLLETWGDFKAQTLNFDKMNEHNPKALELFNKSGWK